MKRLLLLGVVLSISCIGVAQASVDVTHPDQFFFPNTTTIMKLTNYESEINNVALGNIAGTIEPGDRLRGIFSIKESNVPGDAEATRKLPLGFELTGIFDLVVQTVRPYPGGGTALFEFAPEASFEALYGPGAMLVAFYDTTPDFSGIADGTMAGSEATATDGLLYMTLGAVGDWGDVNGDGVGYYWASNGSTQPSVSSFAASLALLTNNSGLQNSYFLNVTQVPPISPDFPPVIINDFTNEALLGAILNAFGLQGNTVANTDIPFGSPWHIKSQDPLTARVVPEPASLLVFAGLFGLVAVVGARRRGR